MKSAFVNKDFPRIGIVGGGQLGKMLAQEARKMNFFVVILDPLKNCPASKLCDEQIVAAYSDFNAIRQLAEKSDFITFEFDEAAESAAFQALENNGYSINPKPSILAIIKSKSRQKSFLEKKGFNIPKFVEVNSIDDLQKGFELFGKKAMLKLSRGGYDGRGNFALDKKSDLESIYDKLRGNEMFLEEWVDFEKELSVMVVRGLNGEMKSYPVVENIHWESILDTTLVPAQVSVAVAGEAKKVAERVVLELNGVGVFGIEMFLYKGKIFINEIAPRVHNSGHYTIEACKTSQFENHLRAIMGLPLGSTELLQNAVMINILGKDRSGDYYVKGLKEVMEIDGANIHIYGKEESRFKRKMGHITILNNDLGKAILDAKRAKELLVVEGR